MSTSGASARTRSATSGTTSGWWSTCRSLVSTRRIASILCRRLAFARWGRLAFASDAGILCGEMLAFGATLLVSLAAAPPPPVARTQSRSSPRPTTRPRATRPTAASAPTRRWPDGSACRAPPAILDCAEPVHPGDDWLVRSAQADHAVAASADGTQRRRRLCGRAQRLPTNSSRSPLVAASLEAAMPLSQPGASTAACAPSRQFELADAAMPDAPRCAPRSPAPRVIAPSNPSTFVIFNLSEEGTGVPMSKGTAIIGMLVALVVGVLPRRQSWNKSGQRRRRLAIPAAALPDSNVERYKIPVGNAPAKGPSTPRSPSSSSPTSSARSARASSRRSIRS